MALVDSFPAQGVEAAHEQFPADATTAMTWSNNEMMNESTPAVVSAKNGADELLIDCDKAHVGVSTQEGTDRATFVCSA